MFFSASDSRETYLLKRNDQPVSVFAPTLNTAVITSVGRLEEKKGVKHENKKNLEYKGKGLAGGGVLGVRVDDNYKGLNYAIVKKVNSVTLVFPLCTELSQRTRQVAEYGDTCLYSLSAAGVPGALSLRPGIYTESSKLM